MARQQSKSGTTGRRSGKPSIQRIYYHAFDELGRKDFLSALALWVVIEIVSFLLLPGLGAIQPGDRLKYWFYLSLPLGIGGAFLVGASSRFIAMTHEKSANVNSRMVLSILGQFGGWFGLAGILFPFVMVVGEFFARIFPR